jgi:hypothetical protein
MQGSRRYLYMGVYQGNNRFYGAAFAVLGICRAHALYTLELF